MSNIDTNAQAEMQKLQDVLNALIVFQTALSTAQNAFNTNAQGGQALLLNLNNAVAPFNQRLTDMINGINDAGTI